MIHGIRRHAQNLQVRKRTKGFCGICVQAFIILSARSESFIQIENPSRLLAYMVIVIVISLYDV